MAPSLAAIGELPAHDVAGAQLERLIHVVEKQPACLIRAARNGELLAVNEAALSLLGGPALGAVLGTSFADRFLPHQRDLWGQFSARVWKDGAASAEWDIVDFTGGRRAVLVQALARRDDPDGLDSLFLTIRDISTQRRLEQAVEEAARIQDASRAIERELEQARAECVRLQAAVREKHEAGLSFARRAEALLDQLQMQLATEVAERKRLARQISSDLQPVMARLAEQLAGEA